MPVPKHEQRTLATRVLRALPWAAGLVLTAGVVAFAVAHYGTTDKQGSQARSSQPAQLPPASGKPVSQRIDPAARRVAARFIDTAVAGKNLDEAWRLTAPALRAGTTYREWIGGTTTVVPYPMETVDTKLFKVTEQYPNELFLDVALIPKEGVKADPALFKIGLRRVGAAGHKRWLVDYWMTGVAAPVRSLPGGGGPGS